MTLQTSAPAYLVTRYDDVRTVPSDPRFSRAALRTVADRQLMDIEETEGQHLDLDPPEHTRLRRVLSEGFTSRQVARVRRRIQQCTKEMLTAVSQRQPPVDLLAAFISPFPLTVICDLLGIPAQSHARVREWRSTDAETPERSHQAAVEIFGYVAELAEARRKQPADDLLSNLVATCDAGRLSHAEVVTMAGSLAIGGHETAVSALGRGLVHLLRPPKRYRSLATENARTTHVIDEMLRLAPAVQYALPRVAMCDVEFSGERVPAGSLVVACLTSANRDTRCFANPEQIALDRGRAPHLSFGRDLMRYWYVKNPAIVVRLHRAGLGSLGHPLCRHLLVAGRIGHELLNVTIDVRKPIRVPRARMVKREHLERAIELALLKLRPRTDERRAVLVLLDGDGELPCRLGPHLQQIR